MPRNQFLPTSFVFLFLAAFSSLAGAFVVPNGASIGISNGVGYGSALNSSVGNTAVSNLYKAPPAPKPRPSSQKIEDLTSLQSFLDYIDNAPPDSLMVVKFYGRSCQLCKRTALKYKKLAKDYGDAGAPVQFSQIEKAVHPNLFETLQVTTFPYIQIYRNGQCIASHGTESEKIFESIINDTLQNFLRLSPEHWEGFLTSFQEPIQTATNNFHQSRAL